MAGEAAFDLSTGFSFGGATRDVVAGGWLVLNADLDLGVQCAVELSIAVAVQPIARRDLAAVRWDRRNAGEHRKSGFGVNTAGWDHAHSTVAATIGPTPNTSSRSRRQPRMMITIAF